MNYRLNCQLFLVRHGEVANPNHVVYGDLPGFHLTPTGVLQAHHAAEHLADSVIDVVLTSPLDRAVETATAIARLHGIEPTVDIRMVESGQFPHWTGHRWESIPTLFPGELEAYLENADAVRGTETIKQVSSRIVATINDSISDGFRHIVAVGHQDPTQATRLALTGRELAELRTDPPDHAEVIELLHAEDGIWTEISRWSPAIPTG